MKGCVQVFDKEIEYDFLSGWIKFNRLQNGYSQDALAYGICSKSHLSYFENGKKTLRGEIIELLLKKLDIHEISEIENIGKLRQKFYTMMLMVETYNFEEATNIYNELLEMEDIIKISPYNIEYKIYQLLYNAFVLRESYNTLKQDIKAIDNIYSSLTKELKYIFLFVSANVIYRYKSHEEGIEKLEKAMTIKKTPWANYILGFTYCFNDRQLEGIYYLEKALESYEKNGYYKNAMWCHNYLGVSHCALKHYNKGEYHLITALNGAKHFDIKNIYWHLYTNFSYLYFYKKDYEKSLTYAKKAMDLKKHPLLPAYNYAEACYHLNKMDEVDAIFEKYLVDEYKESIYYPFLEFLQLKIYHINEDIFYKRTKEILEYYNENNHTDILRDIRLGLIEHLERKRKYKEATIIYKKLLSMDDKITLIDE
ncbi:MAG: helix-turn-helix domain-containing protein [Vallitalea sp.]|jgi:transcriptional regulator with XRE-family HTH domain|nr:helix-turn-helix domain-containing protein [Vallitalea sp.]MCT4597709.1 helix-turn-helix domain-containing protein [Vallitalea sp.]